MSAPLFWRVPASSLRVGDYIATDDTLSGVRRVTRIDHRDRAFPALARVSHGLTLIPLIDDASVDRLVQWEGWL